jgi:catechol 2,3-dioxygenase-like lactoylglutathione lyase family enzyme
MRPYNNPNPGLFAFFDIPGAKERHQSARVKGVRTPIEAMEILQVDYKTIPLRVQDPGNATLVLVVRDIEGTLASVRQATYPVVTRGGAPVKLADGTRAVLIRDADNRFIELRQPSTIPANAPAGNIIDVRVAITVNDLDRTIQVYRDVFKFTIASTSPFAADDGQRTLTGLNTAEVRRGLAKPRDAVLWFEFVEYKGVDRVPLKMRIQDRGAARIQLRTQNIDAVVAAAKQAGLAVMSTGGSAVVVPPGAKAALVADPNNFFVTLFEAVPRGTAGAGGPPAQAATASVSPGLPPLTDRDREDIKALSVTYRRALFNCQGDEYANLFATPGGYFASSVRGEIREHKAIVEMVMGYDRCKAATKPAPGLVAGQAGSGLPEPVIEATPFGAKAKVVVSKSGAYYDDEYVKTPKGWRFKSRTVMADDELKAGYTKQDFIEIRSLAGDDHGYYEDLYGEHNSVNTPRGTAFGPDDRPFRTSGLQLHLTPEGVRGLAYIRNNGGHYEDLYVKTPQGWRIKERKYFPPAGSSPATK